MQRYIWIDADNPKESLELFSDGEYPEIQETFLINAQFIASKSCQFEFSFNLFADGNTITTGRKNAQIFVPIFNRSSHDYYMPVLASLFERGVMRYSAFSNDEIDNIALYDPTTYLDFTYLDVIR